MKSLTQLLFRLGLVVTIVTVTPTSALPQCVKCNLVRECVWGPWENGFAECVELVGFCDAWGPCGEVEELTLAADGMTSPHVQLPGSGGWHEVASLQGVSVRTACNGAILSHTLSDSAVSEIRVATARLSL